MLKIQKLTKIFNKERTIDNCSFEIKNSCITALKGQNGSGKTTIFNLIAGNIHPDGGAIFFDGHNISHKSVEKIAHLGISRLFQYPSLFQNLTVKENLSIAANENDSKFFSNILGFGKISLENEKRINNILENLNITSLENNLTCKLSFGQKRLVELARAIIKPHKILLLDEPTYGVHSEIKKTIAKLLISLKEQGDTIFLIEHDHAFISEIADYVLTLDAGKIKSQKIKRQSK